MAKRQSTKSVTKSAARTSTATARLQTTKQASASTTRQVADTKQSLELIQTTVHASISTLLYLKNLFIDSCFDQQKFLPGESHLSYDDYASGKTDKALLANPKAKGNPLVVMRRGRSSRLDLLLDWLVCIHNFAMERHRLIS